MLVVMHSLCKLRSETQAICLSASTRNPHKSLKEEPETSH
jgi:hypothetical protein